MLQSYISVRSPLVVRGSPVKSPQISWRSHRLTVFLGSPRVFTLTIIKYLKKHKPSHYTSWLIGFPMGCEISPSTGEY